MPKENPRKDGDVYTPERGSDVNINPERDWNFPNQPNREIGRKGDQEVGRTGREGTNPFRRPGQ